MTLQTEKGIKFIVITQLVSLILAVQIIIGALLLIIFGITLEGTDPGEMLFGSESMALGFGILFFIGGFLCLLFLTLFVLQILGLVFIYKGRYEFGIKHAEKVKTGMILIIVGICISGIPVIGLVGSIVANLGWIYSIVTIARKKHRNYLWAGFCLLILSSIFTLAISLVEYLKEPSDLVKGGLQIGNGALAIASPICMFIAFYGTYKGIRGGEIQHCLNVSPLGSGTIPLDHYRPQESMDVEIKGVLPKKSDASYYLSLIGFWLFFFGLIFASMISKIVLGIFFGMMLLFFIFQIVFLVRSHKHEDSITGKIGNIFAILILIVELVFIVAFCFFILTRFFS